MPDLTSKTIRELGQLLRPEAEKTTKNSGLSTAPPRPGISAFNSSTKEETNRLDGGESGVSSPLTEGTKASPATLQRLYHPLAVIVSTDGILAFEVEAVSQIKFVDAIDNELTFILNEEP